MTRTSCSRTVNCIIVNIYLRRKKIRLTFFRHLYMINRYWTTFETLAEIERGCKERQLCMGDWYVYCFKLSSTVNKRFDKNWQSMPSNWNLI